MNKYLFLLFVSVTLGLSQSQAQTSSETEQKTIAVSLEDRYKVDYEIEGVEVPTAEMLASLDIGKYEIMRKSHENVEIYDESLNMTIILYPGENGNENKKELLGLYDY